MKEITEIRKANIQQALMEYCERFGGQNKAARLMEGVSGATVSQIVNGRWADIADEMWRKVAAQTGCESEPWNAVKTNTYRDLTALLEDAQANSLWMAITGNAGTGKTYTCGQYARGHRDVYVVSCDPDWTKRDFFSAALRRMGKDAAGLNLTQMKVKMVNALRMLETPILILDEADKLSDTVLNSFITLYNELQYDCSVIFLATEFLNKRMTAGVRYSKKGFNELWSRVGRRCVALKGVTAQDIVAICEANGVEDPKEIDRIIDSSESDLRRVQRRVHAVLKKGLRG